MSYKYKKKRLSKGITKDEHRLVEELNLDPDELEYGGLQEGFSYRLVLFTVDRPGHPLHRTTRSVKVMV